MHGRYITLSHRWTKQTELSSTNLSNLENRKQAIIMSDLSKTLSDAIEATRKLGVQYLWIDSICIIQDSQDDWARESNNMMAIYESAWLNIAAAGSDKDNGRLFMRRNPALNRVCLLPSSFYPESTRMREFITDSGFFIWTYIDPQLYTKSILGGFLDQRGWIFQERVLSARTIYFSANELVWECNELLASESLRWGLGSDDECAPLLIKFNSKNGAPMANSLRQERYYNYSRLGPPNPPLGDISLPVYQYWYKSVELFSRKNLTIVSDKLRAIQGIAEALHKSRLPGRTFRKCYRQGVWLDDLAHSLLWYSPSQNCGSIETVPSFSWASCLGEIKYFASDLIPAKNSGFSPLKNMIRDDDVLPSLKARLDEISLDVFGYYRIGYLRAGSNWKSPRCLMFPEEMSKSSPGCKYLIDDFRFDGKTKEELEHFDRVVYFLRLILTDATGARSCDTEFPNWPGKEVKDEIKWKTKVESDEKTEVKKRQELIGDYSNKWGTMWDERWEKEWQEKWDEKWEGKGEESQREREKEREVSMDMNTEIDGELVEERSFESFESDWKTHGERELEREWERYGKSEFETAWVRYVKSKVKSNLPWDVDRIEMLDPGWSEREQAGYRENKLEREWERFGKSEMEKAWEKRRKSKVEKNTAGDTYRMGMLDPRWWWWGLDQERKREQEREWKSNEKSKLESNSSWEMYRGQMLSYGEWKQERELERERKWRLAEDMSRTKERTENEKEQFGTEYKKRWGREYVSGFMNRLVAERKTVESMRRSVKLESVGRTRERMRDYREKSGKKREDTKDTKDTGTGTGTEFGLILFEATKPVDVTSSVENDQSTSGQNSAGGLRQLTTFRRIGVYCVPSSSTNEEWGKLRLI